MLLNSWNSTRIPSGRDLAVVAAMAQQSEGENSVLQLQLPYSRLLREGREELLCCLNSWGQPFLHTINLLTPVYPYLVQLQIASGYNILQQHVNEGPSNAQYTSKFSVASLIDTWLQRKSVDSLKLSHFSQSWQMNANTSLHSRSSQSVASGWLMDVQKSTFSPLCTSNPWMLNGLHVLSLHM